MKQRATFLVFCFLFFVPSAHADKRLTDLLERETSTLAYLEKMARRAMEIERKLFELGKKKKQIDYQVREAQRRIAALVKRSRKQRQAIRLRVRHLYKASRGGFARLMLNAAEGGNLFSRLSAAALILKRDLKEIRIYKKELRLQEAEQKRLLRQRNHQTLLKRRLTSSLAAQKKAQKDQYRMLWFLRINRMYRQKLRDDLNRQQRALLGRIRYLSVMVGRTKGFGRLKGKLFYPVYGTIVGRFGSASDTAKGISVLRNGLTFRTYRRGRIKVVGRGLVRVAERIAGYGNLVIIEHAGGFFTVYGFLSRIGVREGQLLYPGAQVGLTGLDPLDGRPALYFEIRRGHYPEDPTPWFRRSVRKK